MGAYDASIIKVKKYVLFLYAKTQTLQYNAILTKDLHNQNLILYTLFQKGSSMAVFVEIKVIPSSGKQKFVTDKSGNIKVYLKSPPEKGKANTELIKLLSKKLDVPQNDISIALGATTRKKRIKIETALSQNQINQMLGISNQLTIA